MKFSEHLTSEGALWKHSLNSKLECLLRVLGHHRAVSNFLKSARETSVIAVRLLIELLSGKNHLGSVDYDNIISGINERSECRLVLSAKKSCDFCSETSEGLAVSVYYEPFPLD